MSKSIGIRIFSAALLLFALVGSKSEAANAQDSSRGVRRNKTEDKAAPEKTDPGEAADQASGAAGKTLYALVIGVNKFQDGKICELKYCRPDAEALNTLLTDRRFIPFENVRARMLVDEKATVRTVREELEELGRAAAPEDTVIVYFSSHGMQQDGGKSFWVLNDTLVDTQAYGQRELRILPQTALEQSEISRLLNAIHAKRLVVLVDCCFSAATVISTQRGEDFHAPPTQNPFANFKGEGMVVLTASNGTEMSSELAKLGHGAFTYYLLEGLRGAADVNHDNVVELWEIWQYLEQKVTEAAKSQGNNQNPTISLSNLTHGFPLTTYPLTSAAVETAHTEKPSYPPAPQPTTTTTITPSDQKGTGQTAESLQLKWVAVFVGGRTIKVSATEITNRQYLEFVRANKQWGKGQIPPAYHDGDYLLYWPSADRYPDGLDDHPVTRVSWFAAKAFAEWAGGRLPTESEWKTAATGASGAAGVSSTSTPRLYPWGNEWNPALCNSRDNRERSTNPTGAKTVRVGSFERGASIWGQAKIFDMAGNVWEWCDGWIFERHSTKGVGGVITAPVGAEENPELARLIKGGSYLADRLGCMISSRVWANPKLCAEDGGFRVVKD